MTPLRWLLGILAAGLGGGFLFLVILSNAFRRSIGATPNGPLLLILPLAAIGVLLAAILHPTFKPLLHTAAVVALALLGFCIWQIITESAMVLWLGILYLAGWFTFYSLAARHDAPPPREPRRTHSDTPAP